MLKFLKLENNIITFGEEVTEKCSCCGKPMINWYKDIPRDVLYQAKQNGIVVETYRTSGVCGECVKNGGFSRECNCCGKQREFPKEFAYEITHYAKYPDDETDYEYICLDCVSNKSKSVIEMLAGAGDISKVKDAG